MVICGGIVGQLPGLLEDAFHRCERRLSCLRPSIGMFVIISPALFLLWAERVAISVVVGREWRGSGGTGGTLGGTSFFTHLTEFHDKTRANSSQTKERYA